MNAQTFTATAFLHDEQANGLWLGDVTNASGEVIAEIAWLPFPTGQSPTTVRLHTPLRIEGEMHRGLSLVTIQAERVEIIKEVSTRETAKDSTVEVYTL